MNKAKGGKIGGYTIFFRLLHQDDKGQALAAQIAALAQGQTPAATYAVNPASFRQVPNTPFCYWVSDRIRRLFQELPPFEGEGRTVKQGLATADDFRFVRLWWEVPAAQVLDGRQYAGGSKPWAVGRDEQEWSAAEMQAFQAWCRQQTWEGKRWVPFAKGGEYSPYYADIHLVVNWEKDGAEIRHFIDPKTGKLNSRPQNTDYYFRPGLTWPRSTVKGLNVRMLPASCIFADKGPAGFAPKIKEVPLYLGLFNAACYQRLLSMQQGSRAWEVGTVQKTIIPSIDDAQAPKLFQAAAKAWSLTYTLDTADETSHAFTVPAVLQVPGASLADRLAAWQQHEEAVQAELARLQAEIDELVFELYGFTAAERQALTQEAEAPPEPESQDEVSSPAPCSTPTGYQARLIHDLISYALGAALGRWDLRLALDPSLIPPPPDPFAPLPPYSPGMHRVETPDLRNPATVAPWPPIPGPPPAILPDDPVHPDDLIRRLREVMDILWADRAHAIEQEACDLLGVRDLRDYFRRPAGFFADHLQRYSKSRRKAPIYWPLAPASGSYTLWLYYPRLTDQTLYACVQDYVNPKLAAVEQEIVQVQQDLAQGGGRGQRQKLEALQDFAQELSDFREELLRVAKFPYKPNLNDGVLITAAPLWKLFRLPKWRQELEACWHKLAAGNYDWAHLAYAIWPDRVKEKCRTDKSLAIAHGLEDLFVEMTPLLKRGRRQRGSP